MDAPRTHSVKPAAFRTGALIAGKYRVERELGAGGVGVVLHATHEELGHPVAIKYLRTSGMTARGLERFKREAKLAASLRSEHVVKVYDVGSLPNGMPYIVMEYLEGEDLSATLARGPIAIEQAVQWTIEACAALEEAHQLGIVHRDLKPANLFLAKRPHGPPIVKILDFGISKITESSSLPRIPVANVVAMTQQNETFGTPYYMSPEQLVSSTNVDARSDVWALGVCLYELLTGRLPFDGGDDLRQLVADVLSSTPPPIRDHRPEIPIELAQIVHGCLSYDPEQRPRTAAALAERIRPFASSGYVQKLAFAETSLEPSGIHELGWAQHRPSAPREPSAPPVVRSSLPWIAGVAAASLLAGAAIVVALVLTRAPKASPQSLVGVEAPREVVVAMPAAAPAAASIELIELPSTPAPTAPQRAAAPSPSIRRAPAPSVVAKPAPPESALDEFGDRR